MRSIFERMYDLGARERVAKASGGNIGALSILVEGFEKSHDVGLTLLGLCEEKGLTGPEIWDHSKLAKRDPRRTIELIMSGEWIETIRGVAAGDEPSRRRFVEELNRLDREVLP